MILVDTSAWVDFFRGDGRLADAVDDLLEANAVALCGPIVTELRRGLRSASERGRVLSLLEGCRMLDQPRRLWEEAGELGYALRGRGATVKSLDLLIATYALAHGLPLLTADTDFATITHAGVPLALVQV